MKKNIAISFVFIVVCLLVFTVPSSALSFNNSNGKTWDLGGYSVTIEKTGMAKLLIGSSVFKQSWKVGTIDHGLFQFLTLVADKIYYINNTHQKSVVRELTTNNGSVRINEIYSFINGGIDQSVTISNFGKVNISVIALYSVQIPNSHTVYSQGPFESQKLSLPSNSGSQSINLINHDTSALISDGYSVSWLSSMALFTMGAVDMQSYGDTVKLPFGPISIVQNETFTIDPTITQFPIRSGSYDNGAAVYDVNGNLAGVVGLSVNGPNVPEPTENPWDMQVSTQFQPASTSTYGVNKITQTLQWTGNSAGATSSSESVQYQVLQDYYQNYQNITPSVMNTTISFLLGLAEIIAGDWAIAVLIPFAILSFAPSEPTNFYTNTLTRTYDAGQYYNLGLQREEYYTLGYNYGFLDLYWKSVFIFGLELQNVFQSPHYDSNTYNNPVVNYFTYSASYTIVGPQGYDLCGGSDTIGFNIGQYA